MREGIAIADSGPLIAFSRINRLELLHELFLKIIIPVAVWNEVTIRGKGRPKTDWNGGVAFASQAKRVD